MRPTDEAAHLRRAYRQIGPDDQRLLVERILDKMLDRLGATEYRHDFDSLLPFLIDVSFSGLSDKEIRVQKSAARCARWCVSWLESSSDLDGDFAEIVAAYAELDPVHQLRGGRAQGSVGPKMRYAQGLVSGHPELRAKELHRIAMAEADAKNSPFSKEDDGELWDKGRDEPYSFRAFEKLISDARNPKKR